MLETTEKKELDTVQLAWSQDLAIGHELIDADHQDIFDAAQRLHAEITSEEPEYSIVGEVLVELIDHTGGHFAREEALMREIGFPAYEAHKREHTLLMQKVNDLHRQYMDSRSSRNLPIEVAKFIQYGLVRHIMRSDMELASFMRADK
ncbi:MAG TPA: bacteriohemerythrin [Noviherbaspirillum sp.]|nr:bacteriohemerythrin [Noviherbaspirillum sp.]